jgi:hypothetical protein
MYAYIPQCDADLLLFFFSNMQKSFSLATHDELEYRIARHISSFFFFSFLEKKKKGSLTVPRQLFRVTSSLQAKRNGIGYRPRLSPPSLAGWSQQTLGPHSGTAPSRGSTEEKVLRRL